MNSGPRPCLINVGFPLSGSQDRTSTSDLKRHAQHTAYGSLLNALDILPRSLVHTRLRDSRHADLLGLIECPVRTGRGGAGIPDNFVESAEGAIFDLPDPQTNPEARTFLENLMAEVKRLGNGDDPEPG